jgi:hypothetical protein
MVQLQVEVPRHGPLGIAPPWLVMMQRMHARHARLARKSGERVIALPATQDQARSLFPQCLVESGKAVMQPPSARTSHSSVFRRLIVEDVNGNDRSLRCRGEQGRLIGKPEITAEPENGGHSHCG